MALPPRAALLIALAAAVLAGHLDAAIVSPLDSSASTTKKPVVAASKPANLSLPSSSASPPPPYKSQSLLKVASVTLFVATATTATSVTLGVQQRQVAPGTTPAATVVGAGNISSNASALASTVAPIVPAPVAEERHTTAVASTIEAVTTTTTASATTAVIEMTTMTTKTHTTVAPSTVASTITTTTKAMPEPTKMKTEQPTTATTTTKAPSSTYPTVTGSTTAEAVPTNMTCTGRCCAGESESCWTVKGSYYCACDEQCLSAGDCCDDFNIASCPQSATSIWSRLSYFLSNYD